jgi:YD repeat-containing protein
MTLYTYDNNGLTKSVRDAVGNLTTYTYDAASRLTRERTVLGLGDRI